MYDSSVHKQFGRLFLRKVAQFIEYRHSQKMKKTDSIVQLSSYKKLTQNRWTLALSLTIIALVIYYGFIYLVAFQKDIMSSPIGSGYTTWSIALGIGVIVMTIGLTGIYVFIANSKFDKLTEQIQKEVRS